jgi:SAM-dependent methyltransferase
VCEGIVWTRALASVVDYISGETFAVDRCEGCGLLATDDRRATTRHEEAYGPRYRVNRHGFTRRFRTSRRVAAIRRLFPAGFTGRLLDVGCGDGAFALAMRCEGWQVAVTELDVSRLQWLRALGIETFTTEQFVEGELGCFDAVTCWHVLEHLPGPGAFTAAVARALAPAGSFHVSVPNAASLQAGLFGSRWLHLDVPRHAWHFTRQTLVRLLGRSGLVPVGFQPMVVEYDLMGVVQGILNAATARPNLLFEALTSGRVPPSSFRDRAVTAALALPAAAAALLFCPAEWILQRGGTITLTARPGGEAGARAHTAGGLDDVHAAVKAGGTTDPNCRV